MATDPINEYLATAKRATLQTAGGAEALTAAVHQRWSAAGAVTPLLPLAAPPRAPLRPPRDQALHWTGLRMVLLILAMQ